MFDAIGVMNWFMPQNGWTETEAQTPDWRPVWKWPDVVASVTDEHGKVDFGVDQVHIIKWF